MEPIVSLPCYLCKEPISYTGIISDCGHCLCLSCLPFQLYSKFQFSGIKTDFLSENPQKSRCVICEHGHFTITKAVLDESSYKDPQNQRNIIPKPLICDACEKNNAKSNCMDCKQNYCEGCAQFIHQVNKKFVNHTIKNIEQSLFNQNNRREARCPCAGRRVLEEFCLECEMGSCKMCAIIDHKGHKKMGLGDLMLKKQGINYKNIEGHLVEVETKLKNLQKDTISLLNKEKEAYLKEITDLTNEITVIMNKYKEKITERMTQEVNRMQSNLGWISVVLKFFNMQIKEKRDLHPNVIFQILKNFSSTLDKKVKSKLPVFNFDKVTDRLKEVKKFLNLLPDSAQNLITFPECEIFKVISSSHLNHEETMKLKANPCDFMKCVPSLVERGKLEIARFNSNLSSFFSTNNMNLFAIPGPKTLMNVSPINVYNLSLKKKEYTIPNCLSQINILSICPKFPRKNERKILFSGEKSGIFRVYEEQGPQKQFKETLNFNTGSEIIEAVVLEDKFEEILPKNPNNNEKFCAVIAFQSMIPTKIYHLTKNNAQVVKIIMNYNMEQVSTINYYYDEILQKTVLFLGLRSIIGSWDLKTSVPIQSLAVKSSVTSIRFLLDFSNFALPKKFVIFSQNNNLVTIANIDTFTLVKQVALYNVQYIYDLCLWRRKDEVFIVVGSESGMKVLKFDDLGVLANKDIPNGCPVNLRKGWIEEGNKGKREILIGLDFAGNNVGVAQFEIHLYL